MTAGQAAPGSARNDAWKRLGNSLPGGDGFGSDLVWQELNSFFSWYSRAAGALGVLLRSIIEDERKQWSVQMKPPETSTR